MGVGPGINSTIAKLGLMALFSRNKSKGGSVSTTYTQKNDQIIIAVWCSRLESLGIFLSMLLQKMKWKYAAHNIMSKVILKLLLEQIKQFGRMQILEEKLTKKPTLSFQIQV